MSHEYIEILNPVAGEVSDVSAPMPGLPSLHGKTLALLDNGHPGVVHVMARLSELFQERTGLAGLLVRQKPSFSRPCPPKLLDELAERAETVITGVGT